MYLLASKGGRGQLSENGLSFELIQIHGTVFIKGSPAFYRHVAGATAAQLLQGRWLKAPASTGNLASLASLTDLRQLMDTTLAAHGPLVKGAVMTVDGRKVLASRTPHRAGRCMSPRRARRIRSRSPRAARARARSCSITGTGRSRSRRPQTRSISPSWPGTRRTTRSSVYPPPGAAQEAREACRSRAWTGSESSE